MKTPPESFDDALDEAIDALRRGESLDAVLAAHSAHAEQLGPLLDVAIDSSAPGGLADPSPRLASNFDAVRAALRRTRSPAERSPRAWWRRRWAIASVSLPAVGILALAAVGVTGAAAAAVATKPDLPAMIADAVQSSWPVSVLSDTEHPAGPAAPPSNGDTQTPPASDTTSSASAQLTPAMIEVSGIVTDIHDNTFVLHTAGGAWSVHVADTTRITGRLETGAAATVTGLVSSGSTVNADQIQLTSADATSTTTGNTGSGNPPGTAATVPDTAPGPPTDTPDPASSQTPGPPAGHTPGPPANHTPDPPANHTPGPPANHTPPGQGNGSGNSQKP